MDRGLDNWNPMQDDFDEVGFNSYNHGPGQFIPRPGDNVELYVTGIPDEMTEEGLNNLFSQCGEVTKAKKIGSKREGYSGTFGFVGYKTVNEASEALRLLNRKTFDGGRYRLRVQFALTPEEKAKRKKEQEIGICLPSDEDFDMEDKRLVVDRNMSGSVNNTQKPPQFPAGRGFFKRSEREPGHRHPENGHSSGYESTNSGEAFRGQSAGHHSNSSSTSQLSTGSHGEDFSNIPNLYENVSSTSSHRGESVRGRASHHPQFNQGRGRGYSTPARGGRGGVGAGGAGQMRRGMGQTRGLGRGFHVPGQRVNMPKDPSSQYSHTRDPQDMGVPSLNAPHGMMPLDQDDTSSICSSMSGRVCASCGKPASNRCKQCKSVYYCNQSCQHADWAAHRVLCKESFQGECRYWLIFGHCSRFESCCWDHLEVSQAKCSYMRQDALCLGFVQPVLGEECLFWRVKGECMQAHICPYKHMASSQGVDMDCIYWRRGHCQQMDNCHFAHYPENYGVDPAEPFTKECFFWRTSGCRNGADCTYLHIPENQGVDFNDRREKQLANRMGDQSNLTASQEACRDDLLCPRNKIPDASYQSLDSFFDKLGLLSGQPHSSSYEDVFNLKVELSSGGRGDGDNIQRSVACVESEDNVTLDQDPGLLAQDDKCPGLPELEEIPCEQEEWMTDTDSTTMTKSAFEQRFEVSCDPAALLKEAVKRGEAGPGDRRHTAKGEAKVKGSSASEDGQSKPDGQVASTSRPRVTTASSKSGSSSKTEEKWVSGKDRPSTVKNKTGRKSAGQSSSDSEKDRNLSTQQPNVNSRVRSSPGKQGGGDAGAALKAQAGSSTFRGRIKIGDVQHDSLVEGKPTKVLVTHFENPGKFYLCKTETTQAAVNMMAELLQAYNSSECTGYTPEKKELIAAKFPDDGNWYRARVDAIDLDGKIRVTYVDYGNSDEVQVSEIRKLKPEFANLPLQAMLCGLDLCPSGSQWCTEAIELCNFELIMPMSGTEMQATLIKSSGDHQVVDLVDLSVDTNVAQVLVSKGLAQIVQKSQASSPSRPSKSEEVSKPRASPVVSPEPQSADLPGTISPPPIVPLSLPTAAKHCNLGDLLSIQVLEVVNPGQFYIHILSDDLRQLEPLSRALQEHYSQLPPRKDFKVTADKLYACKFTEDNQWYRAVVYDFTPSLVSVQYLDYANYENVPHSHLHPLEGNFRSLQLQAVCCSLVAIEGLDRSWSHEATEFMKHWASNETLEALVVHKDSQLHIEIVNSKKQSINSLLIQKGYAKETQSARHTGSSESQQEATAGQSKPVTYFRTSDLPSIELGSDKEFPVQVTHSTSPTDVVVQILVPDHPMLLKCIELNERLTQIKEAPYQPLGEGELVCAQYEEDMSWYRAEVISISQNKAKVCFIDYGNVEEVVLSSVCKLPEDLKTYPRLGIHCALHGIQGMKPGAVWDPNILQPMAKVWTLRIQSGDPTSGLVVDLHDGDETASLSKDLLEKGSVEAKVSASKQSPIRVSEEGSLCKITQRTFKQEVNTVCMQHYVGPQEMYLSLLDDADVLENYKELSIQLNTTYIDSVDVYHAKQGEFVAVFSQEFSEWYRAEVLSFSGDYVLVYYVDYGNTGKCPVESVRRLKPEFTAQASQVIKCTMYGLSEKSVRWPGVAIKKLESLTSAVRLKVKVNGMKGDASIISELLRETDNVDLVKLLVEEKCLKQENVGWENYVKNVHGEEGTGSNRGSPFAKGTKSAGHTTVETSVQKERSDVRRTVMSSDVPTQTLPRSRATAAVVHADSVDTFYVHLQMDDLHKKLERMQSDMNSNVPPPSGSRCPDKGELVLAPFQDVWYRAEVTAVKEDGQKAKVYFVDFGNARQLDTKDIRKLDVKYTELPKQAVKCCFSGIQGNQRSGQDRWSDAAIGFFQKHVLYQTLGLQYSGDIEEDGRHAVDLISPDKQLFTEVMVEQSLAEAKPASAATTASGGSHTSRPAPKVVKHQTSRPPNPPPTQRVVQSPTTPVFKCKDLQVTPLPTDQCVVMVTDVVSPLSFTLVRIDELNELSVLTSEIAEYCQSTPADAGLSLTTGDLCCALFTADGVWYRAEVIDMLSPAQLEVRFIDYGNIEKQDLCNLRPFKREFMQLKAQGVHCALKGLSEGTQIPPTVTQEFSALVKDKLSQCVVEERSAEGKSVVTLHSHNTDDTEPIVDINRTIQDLLKQNASSSTVSALEENEALRRELAALQAKMAKLTGK